MTDPDGRRLRVGVDHARDRLVVGPVRLPEDVLGDDVALLWLLAIYCLASFFAVRWLINQHATAPVPAAH